MNRRMIALWGAQHRKDIANIAAHYGYDVALGACHRFVSETVAAVRESHGKRAAVEMLYGVADTVCLGGDLEAQPIPKMDEVSARLVAINENVGALAAGIGKVVDAVRELDEALAPKATNWRGRLAAFGRDAQWRTLAFVAGFILAGALR